MPERRTLAPEASGARPVWPSVAATLPAIAPRAKSIARRTPVAFCPAARNSGALVAVVKPARAHVSTYVPCGSVPIVNEPSLAVVLVAVSGCALKSVPESAMALPPGDDGPVHLPANDPVRSSLSEPAGTSVVCPSATVNDFGVVNVR